MPAGNGGLVFGGLIWLGRLCGEYEFPDSVGSLPGETRLGGTGPALSLGILAAVISTWLANVRALREATPK